MILDTAKDRSSLMGHAWGYVLGRKRGYSEGVDSDPKTAFRRDMNTPPVRRIRSRHAASSSARSHQLVCYIGEPISTNTTAHQSFTTHSVDGAVGRRIMQYGLFGP